MSSTVAIIIPAYKDTFLYEALETIAQQTSKDFTLYIGDDCSPYPLYEIVKSFEDKINLVYHRFEENLGGKDLVAQWSRCVALSKEEPLIWFFSDDDVMPIDGVERIVTTAKGREIDNCFFRFPLKVIDANGGTLIEQRAMPSEISAYEFMLQKLNGQIDSAACEYVFSRAIYQRTGGFVNFPMAWCSDDASWIKFANSTGMISLKGSAVGWRNVEGSNISNSSVYNAQKVVATSRFIDWLQQFYGKQLNNSLFRTALKTYIRTILRCSLNKSFSKSQLVSICKSIRRISWRVALYTYVKNRKYAIDK